ncbi:MAG: thioredoxin protein [Firmicutes bacterium]|nr:thioredoxin protein [Bacillota bacterium]
MSLAQLKDATFEQIIYEDEAPCLVIFSRKTCHVCKEIVPLLEELQPKYEGKFGFYYVDVEEDKVLLQKFSLKGVPQILFFNEGVYNGKLSGPVEEEQVEEKIEEVLNA